LTELTANVATVVARDERTLFDSLAGGEGMDFLLFGAGNLGRHTLAGLRHVGVEPLGFVDNNASLDGTLVDGLLVQSAERAALRHGDSAAIVMTIWIPMGHLAYPDVAAQMIGLGCSRVLTFVPLFWKYQEEFLPNFCLDAPHQLYDHADDVRAAYLAFADDGSRYEYRTQLSYLLSSMESVEVKIPSDREWYFPRDLVELSSREVFVDCGAYDGDTIDAFLEVTGGDFGGIVAFEPDPNAVARLRTLVQALPSGARDRIRVDQKAVGAAAGLLRFDGGGTPGSRISDTGDLTVDCVTLDDALEGAAPTFIKMDIEGAEEDALLGGAKTIQTHRPVLAICVYHVQAHLYRLPTLIGKLCPDYTLFLRRQGPHGDLVCFAIPNERLRR
jgi:FkbM family methyltransferase